MKIKQYTYPFENIELSNVSISQVGFEFPQNAHNKTFTAQITTESKSSDEQQTVTDTVSSDYLIQDQEILEFGSLELKSFQCNLKNVNSNYKYAIINILYE